MSQHWKLYKPVRPPLKLKKGQRPLPEELVPFIRAAEYYDWKHFLVDGKKQRAPESRRVDKGTAITVNDIRKLRQWCEDHGYALRTR